MCADLLEEAGCGRVPWLHAGTFGLDPGKAEGFSVGSVPRKSPEVEGRVQRLRTLVLSLQKSARRRGPSAKLLPAFPRVAEPLLMAALFPRSLVSLVSSINHVSKAHWVVSTSELFIRTDQPNVNLGDQ